MAKARVCLGPSLGFRVYGLGLLVLLFSDALVPAFFQHHHHGDDDDYYYLVMAAKMLILLSLLVVLILQQCLEPLFWYYTYYILKPYPKASLPHREPKDVLSWNLTRPADLEAYCKPEPQTPNPKPSTLTPKPRNPKPQTLNPQP